MEEVLKKLLLSAPPDNALWKASEYLVFREEEFTSPVLDLGCGDGKFACVLFPKPIDFGIDIKRGRAKKAFGCGAYRFVIQADACLLPFRNSCFRTVFSACVLEHIPRVDTVLEEVGRVLQPGGKFIFSVPSSRFKLYTLAPEAPPSCLLSSLRGSFTAIINCILNMRHFYGPSRWRTMLHKAGMRLIRFRYILPPKALAFWAHSFFWGNALFPFLLLLYRTPMRGAILQALVATLLPLIRKPIKDGGGLVLVAQKMG